MAHRFIALLFTELKITVELQSHYTEVLLITTTVIFVDTNAQAALIKRASLWLVGTYTPQN